MAIDKFTTYVDRVLSLEGGYVNHPSDPGGETNWGISKRSYPTLNIKKLTREEAKAIYKRDFFTPMVNAGLPEEALFQAFDAAVNHGIGNSIRWVQRAVGVADDGHVGPMTRAAIGRTSEPDIVLRFNAERLRFYTMLSTWNQFGKGWVRRVADDLYYAAEDN